MSKKGKKENSKARKDAKKRRKQANYLRTGPKEGHKGRRQKRSRFGTFKGKSRPNVDASPTPPGVRGRRRSQGMAIEASNKGGKKHAKRPFRPLRKRRKMSSARDR